MAGQTGRDDGASISPDDQDCGGESRRINFLRQFRDGSSRQFKQFTASQFMNVWNHYDLDGNGYIEGGELDGFLREFVSSVNEEEVGPEVLSESAMAHLKTTFMDAFDDNKDEKIDIAEMAQILPTDENFLLLFRFNNPLESSVDFMKIWRKFDKNFNGYIETNELQSFLKEMLHDAKKVVSDDKLNEYTTTFLQLFDFNKDGKLQLSEMARLLPVKQNFLTRPILKGASRITKRDIDKMFAVYDQNKNGKIENEELSGLLKDLLELGTKEYGVADIQEMKQVIMEHWDVDHDGSISKSELRMLLLQQCRLAAEMEGLPFEDVATDADAAD